MNNFEISKKIKNFNMRKNEHPFVILTIFITKAKKEGWCKEEINAVINQAKRNNYNSFVEVLKKYMRK